MAPLPDFPFTSIDSGDVSVDSPVAGSPDLLEQLAINDNYLYAALQTLGKNLLVGTIAGSHVWTVPDNVTWILVEMLGAGGGGGSGECRAPATYNFAGCGGFGAWKKAAYAVTPGSVINFHVGAGGAGALGGIGVGTPGNNGGDGEDSWVISSANAAPGGKGGNKEYGTDGGGGLGGTVTLTPVSISGSDGARGAAGAFTVPGPWEWGKSGACPAVKGVGTAATVYGSGGGGGSSGNAGIGENGFNGGNGAKGFILIYY